MNRYSVMVIAAVLGGVGFACSTSNDAPAADADVTEVESYLAALQDEITDDMVDEILADDAMDEGPAQAGSLGADGADGDVGSRPGGRRRGPMGGGGCVDLVLNFAELEEVQACRDLRDACTEDDGCRDEVRACLDEVRSAAFAEMCEERLAECTDEADKKCERLQTACEEGFTAIRGKARGQDRQTFRDADRMGRDRDMDDGGPRFGGRSAGDDADAADDAAEDDDSDV